MTLGLILTVVIAFGLMIFVHEGGHYLACRFFGVRVERFAIGFGPKLWARRIGETEYAVLAVPLGGYCKPAGGDLSTDSAEKLLETPPKPGEFLYASWWKRVLIFLAGPAMNLVSAVFVLAFVVMLGERIPVERPVLGFIPPKALAAESGFLPGDRIVEVDGKKVENFYTDLEPLYRKFAEGGVQEAVVVVERNGEKKSLVLKGDAARAEEGLGLVAARPPVLGSVHLMSPARKAGLRPGDRIRTVNGVAVTDWAHLAYLIRNAPSDPITLEVERGTSVTKVTLTRVSTGEHKMIGISPVEPEEVIVRREGPIRAFGEGVRRAFVFSAFFVESLKKLVVGELPWRQNLAGPITIVRVLYEKVEQDFKEFLNTVAAISLILCWMNLLPIPVVDGGQVVLCVVEGIRRRPISSKWQAVYQQIGLALVLLLMGMAVFNDVWGLFAENFQSQMP